MILELEVNLDLIDQEILEILKKHVLPMRSNQIQAVLSYLGHDVSYGTLSRKLNNLAVLTLVSREKGSRGYRYKYATPSTADSDVGEEKHER